MESVCITGANGIKEWYLGGKLHREDGPAREYVYGTKEWYQHGKKHRDGGLPAVECSHGRYEYWVHGKRHRLDGPAIHGPGKSHYYIEGKKYGKREYMKIINN